jgi:hypothetical protein
MLCGQAAVNAKRQRDRRNQQSELVATRYNRWLFSGRTNRSPGARCGFFGDDAVRRRPFWQAQNVTSASVDAAELRHMNIIYAATLTETLYGSSVAYSNASLIP